MSDKYAKSLAGSREVTLHLPGWLAVTALRDAKRASMFAGTEETNSMVDLAQNEQIDALPVQPATCYLSELMITLE